MKKILSLLLAIIALASFITGCSQTAVTTETISNDINKNLDKLTISVNKLDTIDNEYLASPDIFPTTKSVSYIVPNPSNAVNKETISENEVVKRIIASNIDTSDIINQLAKNLICDQNGNCYICGKNYGDCDNKSCTSCNNSIIYDNNGNCTNCNNLLQLDSYGNCTNCNKSCTTNSCNNVNFEEFNQNNLSCANAYKNPLETQTISLTDNIDEINNTQIENFDDLNNETNENESQSNNQPKIYYYYEEQSFLPENLKYNPRFITNTQMQNAESNLNSYVIKLQKLYAMTADVMEANNLLSQYKSDVLNSISSTKQINKNFKNLNTTPNAYEIQAINNYLQDINNTTKHIKRANGGLNNEINNINKTNNLGVTSSVDVMNSNYLRILNHLDTRITYHELALSTLEQLRNFLLETIENSQVDNTPSNDIVEDTIINEVPNTDFNNTDTNNNDNVINNENVNDTNNEENIKDDIENDLPKNQEDINEDETQIIDENIPTAIEPIIEKNSIDNDSGNTEDSLLVEEPNEIDKNDTNEVDENNETDSTINSYDDTDIAVISPNIDTYQNDIDEDVLDNNIDENKNPDLNTNYDYNNNLNNNIVDNDILNNNLNNGYNYNNALTNNSLNNHNNIINQNNLNTDGNITNNNGYIYDNNGDLHNIYSNNHLSNKNDNVNTYEYNTLLESLNQGTVDNGINNL